MNKKRKIILMTLSYALVALLVIMGTIAYLTSTDSDVNVMTMGNVKIEQIEQEWNSDKTELQGFTQCKPLMTYVGALGWKNKATDNGAYRRFTMNNVVDKYVSVKNTGKSDAYIRAFIALEMGDYSYDAFKMVAVHEKAIAPGETTIPSLLQVYLSKDATNETVEKTRWQQERHI